VASTTAALHRKEADKTISQAPPREVEAGKTTALHRKGVVGITIQGGEGVLSPLPEAIEEAVEGIQAAVQAERRVVISGQQMMSGLTIISLRMNSRIVTTMNSQTKINSWREISLSIRVNLIVMISGSMNMWRVIRLWKMSTQIPCWKPIQGGQY